MAGEAWPIDASGGAPSFTAAEGRQLFSAHHLNTTTDAFGVRAGRRPGSGMVGTLPTSTTYQVTPGAYVAMPAFAALQGPYLCQFGANETGSVNAAHATLPRKDILQVIVDDASAGDGSSNRRCRIVYKAGTANASPVIPPLDARANLFGTIDVPASGGGSPTFTPGPMAVAAGGILPCLFSELSGFTAYNGLTVFAVDKFLHYVYKTSDSKWHALCGRVKLASVTGAAGTMSGAGPNILNSGYTFSDPFGTGIPYRAIASCHVLADGTGGATVSVRVDTAFTKNCRLIANGTVYTEAINDKTSGGSTTLDAYWTNASGTVVYADPTANVMEFYAEPL